METLPVICLVLFIINMAFGIVTGNWSAAIGWACAAMWVLIAKG